VCLSLEEVTQVNKYRATSGQLRSRSGEKLVPLKTLCNMCAYFLYQVATMLETFGRLVHDRSQGHTM
jgi:hypothetical protein